MSDAADILGLLLKLNSTIDAQQAQITALEAQLAAASKPPSEDD